MPKKKIVDPYNVILKEIVIRPRWHPVTAYLKRSRADKRLFVELYKWGPKPGGGYYHKRFDIGSGTDWRKIQLAVGQLVKFLDPSKDIELTQQEISQILKPLLSGGKPEDVQALQNEIAKLRKQQTKSRVAEFRKRLREFRKMIESKKSREREAQKFLQKNFWMLGTEYIENKPQRMTGAKRRLDFLAERAGGSFDIIELKGPNQSPFKMIRGKRTITNVLRDAIIQVMDYIDYHLEQRASTFKEEGLDIYKPKGVIIVGTTTSEVERASLRQINSYLHNIEVLTYDIVLEKASNVIKLLGSRKIK
jgi:hypothetical protein